MLGEPKRDPEVFQEQERAFSEVIWPHILRLLQPGLYAVNRTDHRGMSAFLELCWRCQDLRQDGKDDDAYRLTERLIELDGEVVNQRDPSFDGTPLIHVTYSRCNIERRVQLLLPGTANINAQELGGHTFMHSMVIRRDFRLFEYLFTNYPHHMLNIDYTIKDDQGRTVIGLAKMLAEPDRNECWERYKEGRAQLGVLINFLRTVPPRLRMIWRDAFFQSCPLIPDLAVVAFSYLVPTPSMDQSSISS